MRIVSEILFLKKGGYYDSKEFENIMLEIREAIKSVSWNDDQKFVINPVKKGNGVNPIKTKFVKYLKNAGWETEHRVSIVDKVKPGPIDAIKTTSEGIFAVEWETGNISSSHRALNKISLGLIQKKLLGGILILPTRELASLLTDRIGNLEELQPYFPLYKNLQIDNGFIGVVGVSFDALSKDAIVIPKGKDGNAEK